MRASGGGTVIGSSPGYAVVRIVVRVAPGFSVVTRTRPEPALMRMPPTSDEIRDEDAVGSHRLLREDGHDPGDLAGREAAEVAAVEPEGATRRAQQAREPPQQGRLAAAVRADDRRDRPVGQGEAETIDDGAVVVAERHRLGAQLVGGPF